MLHFYVALDTSVCWMNNTQMFCMSIAQVCERADLEPSGPGMKQIQTSQDYMSYIQQEPLEINAVWTRQQTRAQ